MREYKMEELLLKKLGKVEAPPGFEQRVMAELSLRKRKQIKVKHLRFSLAGAFGFLMAVFIAVNFLLLPQKGPDEYSWINNRNASQGTREASWQNRGIIPITESMDYSKEVRTSTRDSGTIYILERVSDSTDTKIRY
jgi:hypothetical protein